MIHKCEIIVKTYSQINYEFYFFKREYLIFVNNMTIGIYWMF